MKKRILHINTKELGGAAKAALRLHEKFIDLGYESNFLMLKYVLPDAKNVTTLSDLFSRIIKPFYRMLEAILLYKRKSGMFSSFIFGANVHKHPLVLNADVIYLHWIAGNMINWYSLKKILDSGKPVYWFMHDYLAMTGGCHNPIDCVQYTKECKKCPKCNSLLFNVPIFEFMERAKMYNKYPNLKFIVPSLLVKNRIMTSFLLKNADVTYIPNFVDIDIYKPLNKQDAKKAFNFNLCKKQILFGAAGGIHSQFKGWVYLEEALLAYRNSDIEVIIFGCTKPSNYKSPFDNVDVRFLGSFYDDISLSLLYNAADVFVVSSEDETFCLTALEALACGTPVVGFPVGAIPEMFIHKDNGYIAEYKNTKDLLTGLEFVLNNLCSNIPQEYICSNVSTTFDSNTVIMLHQNLIDDEDN